MFCLLSTFLICACRPWDIPVTFPFTAIAQISALWKRCIKSSQFHSKFSGFLGFLHFLEHAGCVLCFHTKSVVLPIFLLAGCAVEAGTGCQAPLPACSQQERPWAQLHWRWQRHKKGASPVERDWTGLKQAVPLKHSDVLSTCGECGKRSYFCCHFFPPWLLLTYTVAVVR